MSKLLRYLPLTLAATLLTAVPATAETPHAPEVLSGTRALDWPEVEHADMADRMMDGAHRYVDRRIEESIHRRPQHWNRDSSAGRDAYEASIQPNRDAFRRIIGVVDERPDPVVMQRFGDDRNPALVAETDAYQVYQVRWKTLAAGGGTNTVTVWAEGLLVEPRRESIGYVVVLPDAGQTPEQLLGLAEGIAAESRTARRLAEAGFTVVVPMLIDRRTVDPESVAVNAEAARRMGASAQTHREWLYRQSFHMGRHVIGYEVQKVLAAVDWFEQRTAANDDDDGKIGVAGYGEGGLIAFYAAAADARIDAVLVSGYFDARENSWTEPLDRNVWALLEQFGDAEIATLVAPRALIVEQSRVDEWDDAKGALATPAIDTVVGEFSRIEALVPDEFQPRTLIHGDDGEPVDPGSAQALTAFAAALGAGDSDLGAPIKQERLHDRRTAFDPAERHYRQFREIEAHVQQLVRNSHRVREEFYLHAVMPEVAEIRWSTETVHDTQPPEPFAEASGWYRDYFHTEINGWFDDEMLPPDPRTRLIYQTGDWAGYDVVLDVFEDLVAWGVLVLPHGIEPGERRPVVVVQHGRNGLPENLIVRDHPSYRRVAARLAERGFVVFVPHNLYRTESRYRPLNRKANTVKATLYSFIVHQHDQILRWLNTLPFVDGERIAFYGNSFGGETAVRVAPLLEGYALSISASYFNAWTRKVAGANDPFSYIYSGEWEIPVFNAGHTFDHAELAYLMVPRPFMVERGHHDHVAHDRWVAYEYAHVRRLYAMLGIADRTAITFFQGGHGMRLEASLDFLHHHLDWPHPDGAR